MAVLGRYTTILVDGYNLDGASNSLQIQVNNGGIDVTPFQSTGKQSLAEPPEATVQHGGYFNGSAAGTMEKTLYDRLDSQSAYVTTLWDTRTTDCIAYICPATGTSNLQINSPVSGVMTVQATWLAGLGLKRGKRFFGGLIGATGAQAYIDLGAVGTNGFAYLHTTNYTGTVPTNATATVQSANNTGFTGATTHGTFTIANIGALAMTITGTINRYVRLNMTSMGSSDNIVLTALIVSNGVTMLAS